SSETDQYGAATPDTYLAGWKIDVAPHSDFSITASPASLSIAQNAFRASSILTAVTSGAPESVALSSSGLPSGATATFSPTSVTAGGSSTLTITVAGSAPAATYVVIVSGTTSSLTHTATLLLFITLPVDNDFSIAAS